MAESGPCEARDRNAAIIGLASAFLSFITRNSVQNVASLPKTFRGLFGFLIPSKAFPTKKGPHLCDPFVDFGQAPDLVVRLQESGNEVWITAFAAF
jgi:hypothetical protein